MMSELRKTFEEQGYVLVKNFIPKETAKYLYEYLKFSLQAHILAGNQAAIQGDDQVIGSYTRGHGDLALDSLMKMMKPCFGLIPMVGLMMNVLIPLHLKKPKNYTCLLRVNGLDYHQ